MAKADALSGVRYLTFAGGGGKGIVYLGVIKALEEAIHGRPRDRSWTRIQEPERVPYRTASFPPEVFPDTPIIDLDQPINERPIIGISGASAGAITAFMLAMGMASRKIFEFTETLLRRRLGPSTERVQVSPFETFFGEPNATVMRAVNDDQVNEEHPFRDDRSRTNAIEAVATGIADGLVWLNTEPHEPMSIAMQRVFRTKPAVPVNGSGVGIFGSSLISGFGLFTGLEVRFLFEELLTKQLLDKIELSVWIGMFGLLPKKASSVSFAVFMQLTGVDLVITGTNLTTKRPVVFSFGNTPDFPVTEAVGISMSIPLLFKPVRNHARVIKAKGRDNQYNKMHFGYYVDGGMLNNVPIHVFDHCIPQVHLHKLNLRVASPIAWSLDRAKAEGWSESHLAAQGVSRDQYKALSFVFEGSVQQDLAQRASGSAWPAISIYAGELLDTLLYSANEGQFQSDRRRAELVFLDAEGVETADFSSIALDALRASPKRDIKMMAIMNAYNSAWDRIE